MIPHKKNSIILHRLNFVVKKWNLYSIKLYIDKDNLFYSLIQIKNSYLDYQTNLKSNILKQTHLNMTVKYKVKKKVKIHKYHGDISNQHVST